MIKLLIKFSFYIIIVYLFHNQNAQAMSSKTIEYKVVFQLSSGDTLVHKAAIKQLNNLLKAFDKVTIEVVVHGQGYTFLSNDSAVKNSIELLSSKGVIFLICQNTINEKKIDLATLSPIVKIIPSGLAHIVIRQSEGWAYLKAGF